MSNEIKIKISSETNTSGFDTADAELRDVKTAAEKAAAELRDLKAATEQASVKLKETELAAAKAAAELHDVETASDKAGNAAAGLSRETEDLTSDLSKLDRQIMQSKAALAMLAGGLADTEDAAQRLDIKRVMDKVQADLNQSLKARKIVLDAEVKVDVDDSGGEGPRSFISKFMDGATKAAGPLSKVLGSHVGITVGVSAAAAAAPVLVSGIASALSAGIGAGVLGAGVALAVSGDKAFQSAGKDAGKKFLKGMQDEAKIFAEPLRASLGDLEDFGGRLTRKWGEAFDAVRGNVQPFIGDIITGTERISDALTNVAKASGEESLGGLGDTYKLLADGVGDFIEILSDGGPEAADNLRLIAGGTADVLRQTATFLDVLNSAAQNEWIAGPLLPALAEKYEEAADATGTFAKRTQGVTADMQAAADAALGEKGALEALSAELKAQADPVFAIIKAQNDLKTAQEETAEATKKHGANSDEAEAALQKQALAALALESNIGKLGDTFDGKLTPSMRATFRAAGLTDDAINGLEKQFMQAKRAGDRFSDTYRARAVLDGYRDANGKLNGLLRDLNNFEGTWTATMITNYVKHGKPGTGGGLATGGIKGAANGGLRSDLTWVGEQGPELVDLPAGTRVHSNPDSMRMAASGGGGGGPITVNLVVDGRVLARAMMDPTRQIIGDEFGGLVQNALGR